MSDQLLMSPDGAQVEIAELDHPDRRGPGGGADPMAGNVDAAGFDGESAP